MPMTNMEASLIDLAMNEVLRERDTACADAAQLRHVNTVLRDYIVMLEAQLSVMRDRLEDRKVVQRQTDSEFAAFRAQLPRAA